MNSKRLLLAAILTVSTMFVTSAQVPSYVPTNGLWGYWSFSGNANDESGNGQNGTVTAGTLVSDRLGLPNGAYQFDGLVNGNIILPLDSQITNIFTIMMWVKPLRAVVPEPVYNYFSCIGGNNVVLANSNQNWAFFPNHGGNTFLGVGFSIGTNAVIVAEHASNILTSRHSVSGSYTDFVNVIIVYRTDSTFLFLNGIKVSSSATLCPTNPKRLTGDIYLANKYFSPNFNGVIDEVGIWNRPLTDQEISTLYMSNPCNIPNPIVQSTSICGSGMTNLTANGGSTYKWYNAATGGTLLFTGSTFTTPYLTETTTFWVSNFDSCESNRVPAVVNVNSAHISQNDTTINSGQPVVLSIDGVSNPSLENGLVAYYPFNGNSNDESGNGNNGTVHGAALTADRFGNANKAYIFNGYSDYITVNDAPNLNNRFLGVSFWVNHALYDTSHQVYVYKSDLNTAYNEEYASSINFGNTDSIGFSIKTGNNCSNPAVGWHHNHSIINILDNTWHFVSLTYDGQSSKFYLDAVLKKQVAVNNNQIDSCPGGKLIFGTGWDLTEFFNGKMDDIRIYNRALTPTEIAALFNEGSTSLNYSYQWSNGANTPSISVSPIQSTTYYVTISNGGVYCVDSAKVYVNGGSIGSVVMGKLSYDNPPISSPMSCTKIMLKTTSDSVIDSTFTDIDGNYQFSGIVSGSYYLSAKTVITPGGFNSTDALLVTKHFTDLITLSGLKFLAGDVNGTNYINSTDALIIAKRYTLLIPTFIIGDWIFEEPQVSVNGSDTMVVNFKGICAGDVNGSYIPPIIPNSHAGTDQINIQDTMAILNANIPSSGETGTWTIVAGIGGVFDNIHNPQSSFTGLSGQTYHLAWTVANTCSYGSSDTVTISFNTIYGQPCPGTPSIVYGGQTYNTVQIGSQCWMKQNLNIGTMVSSINTGSSHSDVSNNGIIEKYCPNNNIDNCAVYGGLYDWDEMMEYSTSPGTKGICPIGWHIPTTSEWNELTNYLGGSSLAGGKMKEIGFTHWASPNTSATNESGFTALGAGERNDLGYISDVKGSARFWSSEEGNIGASFHRFLYYYMGDIGSDNPTSKSSGLSVRCLKTICPGSTTQSEAGANKSVSGVSTNLEGNTPTNGVGIWKIISGSGGIVAQTNNPTSFFSGSPGATYLLTWTISSLCTSSTVDTVSITFNNPPLGTPCPSLPTFNYGGQTYNTVQIGTQCWMRENLNIGTMVTSTTAGNPHSDCSNNGLIEKYCYNNDTAMCSVFGALYDWDEMMGYSTVPGIQGICPTGWHIPTSSEWNTLTYFLGGTIIAGGKMKETGFVHWAPPNTSASNESGFTALGAGDRLDNGSMSDIYSFTYFWTSDEGNANSAYRRNLANYYGDIGSDNPLGKTRGFSVRCIKN